MEHDEEIPAVVRSTVATSAGIIAGGDAAVAVAPGLESGGGSAVSAGVSSVSGANASVSGANANVSGANGGASASATKPPAPSTGETPASAVEKTGEAQEEEESRKPRSGGGAPAGKDPKGKRSANNVRRLRIERMMSKAELARRANLSVLTIDRVEKGYGCRMDSKRKILEALGLSLADRVRVFGEEE